MLFDHSMDAIFLNDPRDSGKILSANPAACRMLGWTKEELIGKGRDVMFDLEDPALSNLLGERTRSGSAKAQLTYRRKDGTTFPGELSTASFTDNNREPRTVAIIRDITERKLMEESLREAHEQVQAQSEELQVQNEELQAQSEELHESNEALRESENKFRTLAENSPDLIARFDRQNRCLYANPANAKFYGHSLDKLIGKINPELERDPEMANFSEKQRENVFTTGKNKIMSSIIHRLKEKNATLIHK